MVSQCILWRVCERPSTTPQEPGLEVGTAKIDWYIMVVVGIYSFHLYIRYSLPLTQYVNAIRYHVTNGIFVRRKCKCSIERFH